ncbi:MAG: NAD(P)/FAD-dependent oxidoreductase [Leptolyngbyaceae cyanobacterium SM2_5_2]|nr:NAD(P)/FAD-dependent oxidoreductase [Leptolyngbyaceae cyanobacterium SM2_5_2]
MKLHNGSKSPSQGGSVPQVVIVGGGFAGVEAAKALGKAPAQVTLIDRTNHHLFQPLLYQVAAATLSVDDIASPIRQLFQNQKNTRVLMAEVTGIDSVEQRVFMGGQSIPYDYLILASGAQKTYFGNDHWAKVAPGLKTVEDAINIRNQILLAFEQAEVCADPQECQERLTFVLVGGGPTGVELAGTIAEMARLTIDTEFDAIDPTTLRIILVQSGPRILPMFAETLSAEAQKQLENLGVEVLLDSRVKEVDDTGVWISVSHPDSSMADQRIACRNVFWTAGVQASPAGKWLEVETDRAGRVKVNPDLSVPGLPNVFAVGDTAAMESGGKPVPGLAQGAMQSGRYAARVVAAKLTGKPVPAPFVYNDLGSMATIGRTFAVMEVGTLKWSGLPAKLAWLAVHIAVLNQLENQLSVLLQWAWTYMTKERGARIITTPVATPDALLPRLQMESSK